MIGGKGDRVGEKCGICLTIKFLFSTQNSDNSNFKKSSKHDGTLI